MRQVSTQDSLTRFGLARHMQVFIHITAIERTTVTNRRYILYKTHMKCGVILDVSTNSHIHVCSCIELLPNHSNSHPHLHISVTGMLPSSHDYGPHKASQATCTGNSPKNDLYRVRIYIQTLPSLSAIFSFSP
jgi:hypothetical protein